MSPNISLLVDIDNAHPAAAITDPSPAVAKTDAPPVAITVLTQ